MRRHSVKPGYLLGVVFLVLALLPMDCAWAAFGEDTEAPKPSFSQEGGDWIVALIPRGKSTEIKIRFHVTGGRLASVLAKGYTPQEMPNVDKKTFRSDYFTLQIIPTAPGGEVSLSMSSNYFTTATELWAAAGASSPVWQSTGAVNVKNADRSNTLTQNIRDGGPLDADGRADGRIEITCGPRDSFWGYALGTLFIRFFGVFIVLGFLEVGMLISGRIFQSIEKRAQRPAPPQPPAEIQEGEVVAPALETAAVIALALHLQASARHGSGSFNERPESGSAWALRGRAKLMDDRMPIFDRMKRK